MSKKNVIKKKKITYKKKGREEQNVVHKIDNI